MKRVLLATLVALLSLFAFAPAVSAKGGGGGHYYVPIFVGGTSHLPDAEVGSYDQIHRVAILSSVGSQFILLHHDYWNSKRENLDISGWKIDAMVGETLRKYLSGRFEFVDANFDPAAMFAVRTRFNRESDTQALLKTLRNPGVDAYLLVRPAQTIDMFAEDQGLSMNDVGGKNVLWLNFEIDLIDAHTLKYIAQSQGRIAEREGDDPHLPAVELPPGFWQGIGTTLTPGKRDVLERYVRQLVTLSVVETIRSLQFNVSLPPTGDHSIAEPVLASTMTGLTSVAVISAIGERFQFINPGNLFVKKTEAETSSIAWGIDNSAEASARAVLAQHYTVKQIPADRNALSSVMLIGRQTIPVMPGLTATDQVDAYVLILNATAPGSPYHGVGLRHSTALAVHEAAIYADYAIVVINARTLKGVAGYVAVPGTIESCAKPEVPSGVPECRVDEKLWPDTPDKLTDAAEVQLRQTLTKILSASIPETLFNLGLDEPSAASDAH